MTRQTPAPRMYHEPNFVLVPPDAATARVERLRRQALRLLTDDHAHTRREEADLQSAAPAMAPSPDEPPVDRPASSMIVGIVTMPTVFLALVFGALALFGKPGSHNGAVDGGNAANRSAEALSQTAARRARAPHTASAQGLQPGAIRLGDDWRVQSIALDGDRVALHVEGPEGREILVYDYRDGRLIGEAIIETVATDAVDTLSMLTGPPPAAATTGFPVALPVVTSVIPAASTAIGEAAGDDAASVMARTPARAPTPKPRSLP